LQELLIPHIGLLWERFRDEYPVVQHATPIGNEASILIDASTGAPLPRVWFISSSDNQLVQFQGDRFYFNWRRRGDEYPRYSTIISKFEEAKRRLDTFLSELNLGPLKPLQYELTYFNQIPKGEGWETMEDLGGVFTDMNWNSRPGRFLPGLTSLSWNIRFALPDKKGWLSAKLTQGKRKDDDVPVLVLEIAARGLDEDTSAPNMRSWFDLAHEWIVRGFADLTAMEIQKRIWRRQDESANA